MKETDLHRHLKEIAFANMLLLLTLDLFFDGDVQSLLGFYTLFSYLSPLNDDMRKIELTAESTYEHWFTKIVYSDKYWLAFSLQNS